MISRPPNAGTYTRSSDPSPKTLYPSAMSPFRAYLTSIGFFTRLLSMIDHVCDPCVGTLSHAESKAFPGPSCTGRLPLVCGVVTSEWATSVFAPQRHLQSKGERVLGGHGFAFLPGRRERLLTQGGSRFCDGAVPHLDVVCVPVTAPHARPKRFRGAVDPYAGRRPTQRDERRRQALQVIERVPVDERPLPCQRGQRGAEAVRRVRRIRKSERARGRDGDGHCLADFVTKLAEELHGLGRILDSRLVIAGRLEKTREVHGDERHDRPITGLGRALSHFVELSAGVLEISFIDSVQSRRVHCPERLVLVAFLLGDLEPFGHQLVRVLQVPAVHRPR